MNSARKTTRKGGTTARNEKNETSKELRVGKDSGRVKAFIRLRPFSKEEKARNDTIPYEISEKQAQLKILANGHAEKTYIFDHVFTPNKTNEEVCKVMTQPLVDTAMNGFNGTLMAYGQTGAGKTYTLMSDTGIARSLIDSSFRHMQEDTKHNYKVSVSYLQIYQEKIYDLLSNNGNEKVELVIRENPRTGIYVENLSEFVVRTPTEVLQFLSVGRKRLIFAETKMNRTSSRSHAVFQMSFERTLKEENVQNESSTKESDKKIGTFDASMDEDFSVDVNTFGKDVIIRGKIHICDLAGSERIKRTGASGERLSEAQHINSSLLELGNVIQALADAKTTHVPFRNSVLTRLLQESLGGNCKTSLIVCVSPSLRDIQETKCTLNFGLRAMKVTNTAYVNMEVDFKSLSEQLLKQLQTKEEEIHKIKILCKDEIKKECEELTQKLEQSRKDGMMAEELLKELHTDELQTLKDELYLLQNELVIKNTQMQKLEDSLVSIDDDLRRGKTLALQYFHTEEEFKLKTDSASLSLLAGIAAILKQFLGDFKKKELSEQFILDSLRDLQSQIKNKSTASRIRDTDTDGDHLRVELGVMLSTIQENMDDLMKNSFNENHEDTQSIRYKCFLHGLTKRLLMLSKNVNQQNSIDNLTRENKQLLEQIKDKEKNWQKTNHELKVDIESSKQLITSLKSKNEELAIQLRKQKEDMAEEIKKNRYQMEQEFIVKFGRAFDVTDAVSAKRKDVGVQVEDAKSKGRRLVGTTVEDEEKVITEIKTENVVENKDVRPSRDIFFGFSHTLNRIENMMERNKRKPSDEIASRFGLSPYLSKESTPLRSSSVFDYRPDDSFRASSTSLYKSSFTSDILDSKYSSPVRSSSPLFRQSKYDFSRSYGNLSSMDSFKNSKSIDNLTNTYHYNTSPLPDRPCMACGSRASEKSSDVDGMKNIQIEKQKLERKCSSLEVELEKLRQEKDEVNNLLDDISRVYPNERRVKVLKDKLRIKSRCTDMSTQTNEIEVRKGRDQNSIKVAHIKPFASEDRSRINVSYDLNENNVLQNIETTQASYASSSNYFKPSSPSYTTYSNPESPQYRGSNTENKWASLPSPYSRWSERETDLIEFSPETDKEIQPMKSKFGYSTSMFSNSDQERRSRRSSRDRPQTWYGGPTENKEVPYVYKSHLGKSKEDVNRKELNLPSENRYEDVIFSSNSNRRASWSLPDWMKTKKKSTNRDVRQFIQ